MAELTAVSGNLLLMATFQVLVRFSFSTVFVQFCVVFSVIFFKIVISFISENRLSSIALTITRLLSRH